MPSRYPLIFTNIKYLIKLLKKISTQVIQPTNLQLVKFYFRRKKWGTVLLWKWLTVEETLTRSRWEGKPLARGKEKKKVILINWMKIFMILQSNPNFYQVWPILTVFSQIRRALLEFWPFNRSNFCSILKII